MKLRYAVLPVVLLASLGAAAQSRSDPLNDREIDAMREHAQEPKKRIDLMIGFANERVMAIDRLRTATPMNSAKVADLLDELASVVDEIDDNLQMYNGHSEDLRRPLRHVLSAETEFQKKLAELNTQATPAQRRVFAASMEDAAESISSSTDSAKAMLADQIAKKGEEKDKEKLDKEEAKQAAHPPKEPSPPPDYTGMGGIGQTPQER